jgi:hypothetical protein
VSLLWQRGKESVILSGDSQLHREAQSKDRDALHPATTAGTFLPTSPDGSGRSPRLLAYLTLTALVLFIFATQAIAQGCAQCLDSTRATPPAVQAAYRHAILLLAGFAAAIFAAGTLLLCRTTKPESPGSET